jgi:hypothetical protein
VGTSCRTPPKTSMARRVKPSKSSRLIPRRCPIDDAFLRQVTHQGCVGGVQRSVNGGYIKLGREMPLPSPGPAPRVLPVVAAKVGLYEAIRAEPIIRSELARRLGLQANTVRGWSISVIGRTSTTSTARSPRWAAVSSCASWHRRDRAHRRARLRPPPRQRRKEFVSPGLIHLRMVERDRPPKPERASGQPRREGA